MFPADCDGWSDAVRNMIQTAAGETPRKPSETGNAKSDKNETVLQMPCGIE